jgi:hypothetical protein
VSEYRDGQKVSYVGDDEQVAVGDVGQILTVAGRHSHVVWRSGASSGEVTFTPNADLVVQGAAKDWDDSLDTPLVAVSVRDVYDHRGPMALLSALSEDGHLTNFGAISEEALQFVAGKIREDPSMHEVLAQLQPDEAEEVITVATAVVMRDAFG